jgi:pyrroloquinoline quinone (PQQ) biosynthesis protein C
MLHREESEIEILAHLKNKVEHQDALLIETKRGLQDMWSVLESAINPYLYGAKRARWQNDRIRALEFLKRMEVKIRSRAR